MIEKEQYVTTKTGKHGYVRNVLDGMVFIVQEDKSCYMCPLQLINEYEENENE